MSDDFVVAELSALKDADSGLEAGPQVEARVLEAFRRRRIARVWKRSALAAAIAAGLIAMLVVRRAPGPGAVQVTPALPPPAIVSVEAPAAPAHRPAVAKGVAHVKARPKAAPPGEVATDFFPLMDTPPPFERGELLRVVVPAATMRTVGLPVVESHLNDPVQADILVGQEGLARAIRFVNYQQ